MINIAELHKEISKKIHVLYYTEMDNALLKNDLTGKEVFDLIIDICIQSACSVFHSIPVFFPQVKFTKDQTDDLRKQIIANLEINFVGLEDIKQMMITPEHLKEIDEKGFAMIELPNGETKRAEIKDILMTKEEVSKIKNLKTLN